MMPLRYVDSGCWFLSLGTQNTLKAEFGEEAKFLISHEIFNNHAAHFILFLNSFVPTWQY